MIACVWVAMKGNLIGRYFGVTLIIALISMGTASFGDIGKVYDLIFEEPDWRIVLKKTLVLAAFCYLQGLISMAVIAAFGIGKASFIGMLPGGFLVFVTVAAGIIVSPIVVILCAAGFMSVVEFIIRRIAEYPKGPLLAISGLLAAIASIIKLYY
jgi:hypothetical protein